MIIDVRFNLGFAVRDGASRVLDIYKYTVVKLLDQNLPSENEKAPASRTIKQETGLATESPQALSLSLEPLPQGFDSTHRART